jgi:hypothetical protein
MYPVTVGTYVAGHCHHHVRLHALSQEVEECFRLGSVLASTNPHPSSLAPRLCCCGPEPLHFALPYHPHCQAGQLASALACRTASAGRKGCWDRPPMRQQVRHPVSCHGATQVTQEACLCCQAMRAWYAAPSASCQVMQGRSHQHVGSLPGLQALMAPSAAGEGVPQLNAGVAAPVGADSPFPCCPLQTHASDAHSL